MKNPPVTFWIVPLFCILTNCGTHAQQASHFDEDAIQIIQESVVPSATFNSLAEEFASSANPATKAEKWEDLIIEWAAGLFSSAWVPPEEGWTLLDFGLVETQTLEEIRQQPLRIASYTKLVAQNEADAVRLRGAGSLLATASAEGEQWGERLLLDIAQRPDGNFKRTAYWFTRDFGADANAISWHVDWSLWQQAYNLANSLGKGLILRNIGMHAIRRNEYDTVEAIHLAALSGTNRELKGIALAFGHPSFGDDVIAKWRQIAEDNSDLQLQAIAQKVTTEFQIEE